MSHGHSKKTHKKDQDDAKTKKAEHGDDQGKLSDAMKNKDDDDEVTPGYQPVTPDMPTDIQSDVVALDDLGKDPYDDVVRCKVTANLGAKQGIVEEMKAYLVMKNGEHLPFNITAVRDSATDGSVEGTAYSLNNTSEMRVVFNPAESAPKRDHHKKKHHHHH